MVCNAGGFSNSLNKIWFNASFHTIFIRQYRPVKPTFEALWRAAAEHQIDPIEMASCGHLELCELATGLSLSTEASSERVQSELKILFKDVDLVLDGKRIARIAPPPS